MSKKQTNQSRRTARRKDRQDQAFKAFIEVTRAEKGFIRKGFTLRSMTEREKQGLIEGFKVWSA